MKFFDQGRRARSVYNDLAFCEGPPIYTLIKMHNYLSAVFIDCYLTQQPFWISVGVDPVCTIGLLPKDSVRGEVNLLRFLGRLFGVGGYDGKDILHHSGQYSEIFKDY